MRYDRNRGISPLELKTHEPTVYDGFEGYSLEYSSHVKKLKRIRKEYHLSIEQKHEEPYCWISF